MNRTVAKFLERLTIVVVISVLGYLAESAGALGTWGPALASAASMLLLLVGKLAPAYVPVKPEPAVPVAPPAPKVIIRDRPRDDFDIKYRTRTDLHPETTPAMAEACRRRGLAYPTTVEDRIAAQKLAESDATFDADQRLAIDRITGKVDLDLVPELGQAPHV